MATQTCVSSLWQTIVKWGCISLASSLFLAACGGGYNGGEKFQDPAPTQSPPAIEQPETAPQPTPPPITDTDTPRQMEYLDRGLVAFPAEKGNAVSWRLLGTDNPALSFDVYRNGSKLNESPLTHTTFYRDESGAAGDNYEVHGIVDGGEVFTSQAVTPWSAPYLAIPLNKPMDGSIDDQDFSYVANDATAADLDGDGQYELILKWDPSNAKDNSHSGATGNVLIDAYTLEGNHLWRINLGPNIRAGAHYTQFIAYDFDGDGRAEIAMKTADGTVDGRGVVIGDEDALYRNGGGYILEGPEFLTMFDGLSGEALQTIDYVPARGNVNDWGDDYGNRVDRFLAGLAYLDGESPSLIMARGYYTRAVVAAFDWVDGAFSQRWVFDTNNGGGDEVVVGQGAHSLTIGDVDADGRDEIVYGAATIDDDGSVLYSTALCHGDAEHLGDFDPNRPGLEIFMVHEAPGCYANADAGFDHGVEMHDAATGEILWSVPGGGADIGRGVTIDIDPRFPGNESWGSRGGLTAADGTHVSDEKPGATNFAAWWDGDLLREILDGTTVSKWNYLGSEAYPILRAADYNAVSNNGTKATPTLSADLLGDWREEIIWADSTRNMLMVFSSPHATDSRFHTLMHDSQYRTAIAWQNVAYNQPPHPSFYIGPDAMPKWQANITTTEGEEWAKLVAQGNDDNVEVRVYLNGFDVTGIEIFRDTDADPDGRTSVGTLEASERFFVDETAVPDVTYYYWVELTGSTASSDVSLDVSMTMLTSTLLPSYDVEALSSQGPVRLMWETNNIAISEINVYRVETADPETTPDFAGRTLVGTPDVTTDEWTDASSVPDTAYFYWVEFVDETADTTFTPDPIWAENIPVPVLDLTAEYANSAIEINWLLADFRPAISSVEVYRNTVNQQSGRTRILRNAPVEGVYIDSEPKTSAGHPGPALPGITYWYTLKVVLADGSRPDIPLVPEVGLTIPDDGGLPLLGAWSEGVSSISDLLEIVQVAWSFSSIDAKGIEIFRDTNADGSTRVSIATPAVADTEWQDTSVEGGVPYYYWVEITDQTDVIHAAASTAGILLPDTNLATSVSGSSIELTWDLQHFPQDVTDVQVYRHTVDDALGGRTRVATGQLPAGTFVDDGSVAALESGTTYWYMFKLTMEDGSTYNTSPQAGIAAP